MKRQNLNTLPSQSCLTLAATPNHFKNNQMTKDTIRNLINEELSSFSNENDRPNILNAIQSIVPFIANIFYTHQNKKNVTQDVSLLLENYRRILESSGEQLLIPIHLFLLIVFDRLEKEATNCKDFQLQEIWSLTADKIIDVSLEVNSPQ